MPISHQKVRDVAALAKLSLSEAELEKYTQQLDTILSYMEQLDELHLSHEEVTSHVLPFFCPLREDVRSDSPTDLDPSAILNQAPKNEQGFFFVPKIID